MRTLLFYIFFLATRLIALLPLKGMFVISDFARFFAYRIIRYRRKTVAINLKRAFPEKSWEELKRIERAYYKHFCDLFIEIIYLLFASRKKAMKMCSFNNLELLKKYFSEGKSAIVAIGHYSNWEILSLIQCHLEYKVIAIFKPIKNKKFENFINRSREKFGVTTIPMQDTFRTVLSYHQKKILFSLGLIADQTPARSEIRYWTHFLNQDTPVFMGVEKIAVKINQPVFFCNMRKVARGKYEVDFELLCENPNATKPHEITEMHVRALEKLIYQAPEYWLWSHRRWKYIRVNNTIQKQNMG